MTERSLAAVDFGVLLVLGAAGVAAFGSTVAATPAGADARSTTVGTGSRVAQADAGARNVSAIDALRLAEERTSGTSVGLELERENGTSVYDVTVLRPNGTSAEVVVDAGQPRVLSVTDADGGGGVFEGGDDEAGEDDGFFGGIFGDGGERNRDRERATDLAAPDLRSAAETVEVARNATMGNRTVDPNATVAEVELQRIEGAFVYEVELRSADGDRTEVLVDATPGPVLAVDVEDGDER